MGKQIKVKWREKDCVSTDRIPLEWFETDRSKHGLIHDVFEGNWRGEAMCDVGCNGPYADLDYSPYKNFNRRNKIDLGVMRIHFSDTVRTAPLRAEWKGELEKGKQGKNFTPISAKISVVDELAEDLCNISKLSASKMTLVEARLGQGKYRDQLMRLWNGACAVTGIKVPQMLRASHIKPWSQCKTRGDKFNPYNGLLLSANLDALFDRYLITFDDNGMMCISDLISESERQKLRLEMPCVLGLNRQQREYMKHHRRRFRAN